MGNKHVPVSTFVEHKHNHIIEIHQIEKSAQGFCTHTCEYLSMKNKELLNPPTYI